MALCQRLSDLPLAAIAEEFHLPSAGRVSHALRRLKLEPEGNDLLNKRLQLAIQHLASYPLREAENLLAQSLPAFVFRQRFTAVHKAFRSASSLGVMVCPTVLANLSASVLPLLTLQRLQLHTRLER
jgi:hypothetical protein